MSNTNQLQRLESLSKEIAEAISKLRSYTLEKMSEAAKVIEEVSEKLAEYMTFDDVEVNYIAYVFKKYYKIIDELIKQKEELANKLINASSSVEKEVLERKYLETYTQLRKLTINVCGFWENLVKPFNRFMRDVTTFINANIKRISDLRENLSKLEVLGVSKDEVEFMRESVNVVELKTKILHNVLENLSSKIVDGLQFINNHFRIWTHWGRYQPGLSTKLFTWYFSEAHPWTFTKTSALNKYAGNLPRAVKFQLYQKQWRPNQYLAPALHLLFESFIRYHPYYKRLMEGCKCRVAMRGANEFSKYFTTNVSRSVSESEAFKICVKKIKRIIINHTLVVTAHLHGLKIDFDYPFEVLKHSLEHYAPPVICLTEQDVNPPPVNCTGRRSGAYRCVNLLDGTPVI